MSCIHVSFQTALVAFLLFSTVLRASAIVQNITVLSSDPSISYAGGWSSGASCTGCFLTSYIDKSNVPGGDWMDTTFIPGLPDCTISFEFTGTDIEMYGIQPNTIPNTVTFSDVLTSIDGSVGTPYIYNPDQTDNIDYNALIFSAHDLSEGKHSVELRLTGHQASLLLFNRLQYTSSDSSQAPSSISTSSSLLPSSTSISSFPNSTQSPGVQNGQTSSTLLSTPGVIGISVAATFVLFLGIFLIRRAFLRTRNRDRFRPVLPCQIANNVNRRPYLPRHGTSQELLTQSGPNGSTHSFHTGRMESPGASLPRDPLEDRHHTGGLPRSPAVSVDPLVEPPLRYQTPVGIGTVLPTNSSSDISILYGQWPPIINSRTPQISVRAPESTFRIDSPSAAHETHTISPSLVQTLINVDVQAQLDKILRPGPVHRTLPATPRPIRESSVRSAFSSPSSGYIESRSSGPSQV